MQTLMSETFVGDELAQAQLVLDIVSSWARVVSGRSWPDAPTDVPDDVRAVVLQASRRELKNPDRVISRQMGPFNVQYSQPPDGFFYPAEMAILKRFRRSGGLRTVSTSRGEEGRPWAGKTAYINYEGGSLFPFCAEDEGYGVVVPW
ncbi:head-to-tail adaptor [Mycobacterium phage LeBron]|uniref:Head-to-tail adaptor n=2 Tax=Mycobacterium virus Bron TaxID=861047 RepID=E0YPE2_9CAUD|nr:head-tail adaptor Ad1 [Mycobacterium phage LeBron]ADL70976.1 head-to-tail adaptor [Mycobacterium phage LeBron]AEK07553.1 head-to-tail adaptor [Mycobacterium phage UPIE]